MPKILKAYAGSGVKPKIEVSSNAFKITLPNRNSATRDLTAVSDTTKSKEEQILAWIEANGHIVRSDVDALLHVSQATANRILKRMVADGLLRQEGRGRGTRYKKT